MYCLSPERKPAPNTIIRLCLQKLRRGARAQSGLRPDRCHDLGASTFVMQSTDHISIVPGYDAFNISSEGVGDIVLNCNSIVRQSLNSV